MEFKERGNIFFKQGKWEQAEQEYTKAIQMDSQLFVAYSNRAACYIQLHQYENALKDLEKAIHDEKLQVKVLWRRAVSLRELGADKLQWEQTVAKGLLLDPLNEKLKLEKEFLWVQNVQHLPTGSPIAPVTQTTKDKQPKPTKLVGLEGALTYPKLLQLIRYKPETVKDHIYTNYNGKDLQNALKTAGVEPETLEFFLKLITANNKHPKNSEFLAALKQSPRFETALFMADESLYNAALKCV